ncbi:thioesterase II family protein [Streptodolium elevatio]|uniref:Alpha/beta fold hydrolase n=1 Tax=Streptodolium elevatio TaxID=3157996 RepID=A0ABV3DP90_9ACTN
MTATTSPPAPGRPPASGVDPAAWIRRFHATDDAGLPRLAAFPHAGGSASFWYPLSAALRGRADVLSVQYPGRQERRTEPPIEDIRRLADLSAEAIVRSIGTTAGPGGRRAVPLVLFGHSMGAVVAFEVARRLAADPRGVANPTALVVSGRRAPDRHREERVHAYDEASLIAELRSLSGTDSAVLEDEELLRMVIPALRADYRAVETYRYAPDPSGRPALRCPITVLTGDADPKVSVDEAAAWRDHTGGAFALHTFAGGHFYLTDHQTAVTAHLAAALGIADSGPGEGRTT